MSGRGGLGGVGGRGGKVVYKGRYAVVVDEEVYGLVAYPREDPRGREKEYLLLMIDELLNASDEAFGRTGHTVIRIPAEIRYDNGRFALEVRRDGDVWVESLVDDDMDFMRNADLIEVEVVGRNFGHPLKMYRGRYIVVVKGRGGLLHAFGREDVKLRPGLFAREMIGEVGVGFDPLTELMGAEAVLLRVRVWRNNVLFYPLMVAMFIMDFVPADDDYMFFVERADEVKFVRLR